MTDAEKMTIRAILQKHWEKALEEICNESIDVGYWPDDAGSVVDAALNVIVHQARINEYHRKERTNFAG